MFSILTLIGLWPIIPQKVEIGCDREWGSYSLSPIEYDYYLQVKLSGVGWVYWANEISAETVPVDDETEWRGRWTHGIAGKDYDFWSDGVWIPPPWFGK